MGRAMIASIATGSPTPFNHNESLAASFVRPSLNARLSRPNLKRGAPLATKSAVENHGLAKRWTPSMGDSSDDEVPVPPSMKFSAEVKALLGDEASMIGSSQPSEKDESQHGDPIDESNRAIDRRSPLSLTSFQRERTASPASIRSASPRIVRLKASNMRPSTLRKTSATAVNESTSPQPLDQRDYITPAPRTRSHIEYSLETKSGTTLSDGHVSGITKPSSVGSQILAERNTGSRDNSEIHEAVSQMGNVSISKVKGDESGLQGSLRVKRVGKVTGRYLSGPARRGMRRRQSEESPIHEDAASSAGVQSTIADRNDGSPQQDVDVGANAVEKPQSRKTSPQPERPSHVRFQSQASIITGSPVQSTKESQRSLLDSHKSEPKAPSLVRKESPREKVKPVFKVPPLPLLPSRYDQENEPPPTFKRNKPNTSGVSENAKFSIMSDEKMLINTPATATPKRPALTAKSQNTPHRPAPAPPKMSVLETATAPAGAASASQSRKKRNYISVNGKLFTRMDCIGRGGSSKVYRVMAENYKVFALKRVTLEDQDELAIRGYKGEIDLLRKLEDVDRVVRLFDWELNSERQTLSVLMEMGETDLNRVLSLRLYPEDATFDITFARYFWKEMLECVQAVHKHNIVHSDLKPANFLLMQGRLKLIDFGIANAIEIDSTINVHREQHIGTPNYMSPEALIDSNAGNGLSSTDGKLMKLGKPSDIWSLGCILYQMTYSKPPFAHIPNQMQRVMAIPNPNHIINFPKTGVGGVLVPSGLIRTLKACLNRNSLQRPTVEQLLSTSDPFLYPDAAVRETVPVGQDLIARLQHNIIKHVRERGMPSDAELATWPAKFFASIKAAVEEGRA